MAKLPLVAGFRQLRVDWCTRHRVDIVAVSNKACVTYCCIRKHVRILGTTSKTNRRSQSLWSMEHFRLYIESSVYLLNHTHNISLKNTL